MATIVTVKPKGGVFAGADLKVTLVKSGEVWKIDKISGARSPRSRALTDLRAG